ncbi:MAG: hypothetical protein EA359_05780 [Balneolaceae bacterium]|nr:MAG: hypothetical protein EA359_05780 [Balneolaceae bacterium]
MDEELGEEANLPLLPYRFRYAGFALIILGFGAAYLYFWGGRPAFFEVPVFAIVTSYVETRWFVVAQTNSLDEISFLFFLFGLLFIGFSRDKNENHITNLIRIKILFYSVYLTTLVWGLAYLTVFGWPIIVVSAFIFATFLIVYIILLRLSLVMYYKNLMYQ